MKKISSLLILLALSAAPGAYAEAPNLLTYQGRLKESGQAITGNREISIFLCDAEFGGNCHSNGAQPVAVSNGLFRSTFTIPSAVNFGTGNWWLSLFVGATELSPRERLTSNAYSLFSATAAYAENISAAAGSAGVYVSSNLFVTGGSSVSVSGALGVGGYGVFQSTVQITGNVGAVTNLYFDNAAANAGKVLKASANGFLSWENDVTAVPAYQTPYRLQMVNGADTDLADSLFLQNDGGTNITLVSGSSMTVLGDLGVAGALQLAAPLPIASGGTGAATFTGVLKGNGTAAVSAMTGTADRTVRWSDANTIAASALITDNGTSVGIGAVLPDQELTVAGDISQTGVLISSGTGYNYFAGRVGISTVAPAYALDVMETIRATSLPGSNGRIILGDGDINHGMTLSPTVDTFGQITANSPDGGLNLTGYSSAPGATGAHLGGVIGAEDPTDSAPAVQIDGSKKNGVTWQALGAAETILGVRNNGGGNLVVVKGNGYVGIGTGNPGSLLDVNGEINAGGGLCLGGNCKSSWPFSPGSQSLEMGAYVINSSSHITAAAYQINGSTVLASKPGINSFMAGMDAGRITTGAHGTFVGTNAGYNNTTGQENTFVGSNAGQANSLGEANTTLGYFAGYSMTGTNNTMVGRGAGFYTSTAWDNTFIGKNTGLFNAAGSANVVLGADAGYGDTGGSYSSSTLLGYGAGYNMLTGVGNVLIGYKAGYSIDTGTGNIIIGFEKDAPAAGTNSHLNIGGAIFGDLITGNIGIGTSSPRSRLDVWGSGSLYLGQTGLAHGVIKSDDSMTLNVDANNDANNAFLEITSGVGTTLLHVVQPGLAGVGTSNPMAALDVKSTGTLVSQFAQIWRDSNDAVIASMTATGVLNVGGDIRLNAAGSGLQVAEGADARMGTVSLTAGTATVSNTSVTANTRIFLTVQAVSGTVGSPYVSGRVAGTSFTITSTEIADTSTVAWLLIEP